MTRKSYLKAIPLSFLVILPLLSGCSPTNTEIEEASTREELRKLENKCCRFWDPLEKEKEEKIDSKLKDLEEREIKERREDKRRRDEERRRYEERREDKRRRDAEQRRDEERRKDQRRKDQQRRDEERRKDQRRKDQRREEREREEEKRRREAKALDEANDLLKGVNSNNDKIDKLSDVEERMQPTFSYPSSGGSDFGGSDFDPGS